MNAISDRPLPLASEDVAPLPSQAAQGKMRNGDTVPKRVVPCSIPLQNTISDPHAVSNAKASVEWLQHGPIRSIAHPYRDLEHIGLSLTLPLPVFHLVADMHLTSPKEWRDRRGCIASLDNPAHLSARMRPN
ncbi:hypothetical protein [Thauera sp.]|uniref:hypothetical protein n=1 Tax=Thauera sp. TaxID=1905334 RepID=UPI00257E86C6|nr:hypothetical protein [Thauera sp.]